MPSNNELSYQGLTGKVAVVTGAGQGIGATTAMLLAVRGATVAVADINSGNAKRVSEEIVATGGTATPLAVDVSQRDQVEDAFAAVVERHGRIDVLVNNAGIVRDALVHKMTDDEWDAVLSTNLRGAWLCSQVAQRYFVPQRSGSMVNLSSRSALGNRGQANYSAAKAGLQGLTRTLAIELGRFGIRVNAVAPGHVETDMTKGAAERMGLDYEQRRQQVIEKTPLARTGKPVDIARVVAFLASEEASYVTGQILYVTGGPNV